MAENSAIEWTDATWNPVTGCSVISPGCTNCYAMKLAGGRLRNHPSREGLTQPSKAGPVWNGQVRLNEQWLDQPLRWSRPRQIFVCAHGDLFHESVPDEWIDRVLAVVYAGYRRRHTFQVLTKRADRMRAYFSAPDFNDRMVSLIGPMNVGTTPLPEWWTRWAHRFWCGTSIEDRARLGRLEDLRATPATVRFLSLEPLLEDLGVLDLTGIDWVIVGGESGSRARPMHPDWVRSIRGQCLAQGVPFFFKQWGEWVPWEPGPAPRWESQHQRSEDRHTLFPADFDNSREWDDGLWAIAHGEKHAAFQRVGKKAAGRLLDGKLWDQMPESAA